jgi:hypothetical protein
MPATKDSWFPLFEFQDWSYQSSLVLPTPAEKAAPPGGAVTAKKWAKGTLFCGQAMKTQDGYTLSGRLAFRPGLELAVEAKGSLGAAGIPASSAAMTWMVAGRNECQRCRNPVQHHSDDYFSKCGCWPSAIFLQPRQFRRRRSVNDNNFASR